jgi:hypothetical protein
MYGGMDVQIHVFLTSAVVGGEWSASRSRQKAPGACWIEGRVGPRTVLDDVLPLPRLEFLSLGRPAHSQLLYRLCYRG